MADSKADLVPHNWTVWEQRDGSWEVVKGGLSEAQARARALRSDALSAQRVGEKPWKEKAP